MRTSAVTSLLLWGCVLLAAWTPVSDAATCPAICSKRPLWGTGPQASGYAPCQCDTVIGGLGSGPNECNCGVCYLLANGRVTGFAKLADGSCSNGGTDCGDCDLASGSGSGSGSNSTKTTAPPSTDSTATNTPSPSLTPSASSSLSGASSSAAGNASSTLTLAPNGTTASPTQAVSSNTSTATDVGSSSKDGNSGTTPANANSTTSAPATAKSSSSDGIATWQIALIICSCVLFMAVAMTSITSCYCKARNRMKDNLQDEEERHEYEGYWNPNASGGLTERSGHEQLAQSTFNPTMMTQGGRSSFTSNHSRPNSTKNMPYSEPTYAVDERIGAGMGGGRPAARQSLGSNADLPGVFQPFPQRDVRPSHEVGSRKNIAIEL